MALVLVHRICFPQEQSFQLVLEVAMQSQLTWGPAELFGFTQNREDASWSLLPVPRRAGGVVLCFHLEALWICSLHGTAHWRHSPILCVVLFS